jgi:hypothetical protein
MAVVWSGISSSPALAATPTLGVQPAVALVDTQVVTITGSGFTPAATIRVSECVASDVSRCDPFTEAFPQADPSGGFAYTFGVRREIKVTVGSGEITDCATVAGGCVFAAVNITNTTERASVPFAFDPKVGPLRIEPTVDRNVSLTNNGFTVAVSGTMRCTLPSRVGIAGFISQDIRDPNFGYPFSTFVDCQPHKSAWRTTINVSLADKPFLRGKGNVQVVATPTVGGLEETTTEGVVLR